MQALNKLLIFLLIFLSKFLLINCIFYTKVINMPIFSNKLLKFHHIILLQKNPFMNNQTMYNDIYIVDFIPRGNLFQIITGKNVKGDIRIFYIDKCKTSDIYHHIRRLNSLKKPKQLIRSDNSDCDTSKKQRLRSDSSDCDTSKKQRLRSDSINEQRLRSDSSDSSDGSNERRLRSDSSDSSDCDTPNKQRLRSDSSDCNTPKKQRLRSDNSDNLYEIKNIDFNIFRKIKNWNLSFNLYNRNCRHFSKYFLEKNKDFYFFKSLLTSSINSGCIGSTTPKDGLNGIKPSD